MHDYTQIRERVEQALSAFPAAQGGAVDGAGAVAPIEGPVAERGAGFIASLIDHTLLKPDATAEQIDVLCADAMRFGFASVCVNPTWIERCTQNLSGGSSNGEVRVCTVAGFPLGAMLPETKARETEQAIARGAREIDMVLNIGRLKSGALAAVYEDVAGVVQAAHPHGVVVKVIFETVLLTDEEKVAAALICARAGVDFVKTSTGFAGGGATVDDVRLMRSIVGNGIGVKAAGGVRSGADAIALIEAGATRLGASSGVAIVQSMTGKGDASERNEEASSRESY